MIYVIKGKPYIGIVVRIVDGHVMIYGHEPLIGKYADFFMSHSGIAINVLKTKNEAMKIMNDEMRSKVHQVVRITKNGIKDDSVLAQRILAFTGKTTFLMLEYETDCGRSGKRVTYISHEAF